MHRAYRCQGEDVPVERFDPFDLLVLATTFATVTARGAAGAIDLLDDMVRAHANWRRDRRQFAQSVHASLETLDDPES